MVTDFSSSSVPDAYVKKLVEDRVVTEEYITKITNEYIKYLNEELINVSSYQPEAYYFKQQWNIVQAATSSITTWDTGLDYSILCHVGRQSVYYPENFVISEFVLFSFFWFN